jgi:quinohemoprotein ethanol dehydrogenase
MPKTLSGSAWAPWLFIAASFSLGASLAGTSGPEPTAGNVTSERALHVDSDPGNWLLHGRDFNEQFFSPLRQIDQKSVKHLGVAWYSDVSSPTGIVSQPLMVDGVVYFTSMYSIVTALDAGNGRALWHFAPPNIKLAQRLGTNPVAVWNFGTNRGLAIWEGKVYVTTGDCRLIALDARDGRELWEVQSCDTAKGYGISGAPRVGAGKVFIGNSGSDNGARGYVSAYDAVTGKQIWRFYTIPAKADGKFESEFQALMAHTWDEDAWNFGGGVVYDSMTYDPESDRLYVGTDCGSPLDTSKRNPSGGDQLFECAIVALDASTGSYVWHYTTTPNYSWDYDAVMSITLANLTIEGKQRKVLMQAPKNGFFFVLDRETGRFISAKNYTKVNWATGFDEHGRPIYSDAGKYWEKKDGAAEVFPSDVGGHTLQPMSFSPDTGLAYIPTCEFGTMFRASKAAGGSFGGVEMDVFPYETPADPSVPKVLGRLVAWNPVTQTMRWDYPYSTPCNGGTLSTAGGLVFQADTYGRARAFAADSGSVLWSTALNSAVQSAPITYSYHGEQYVLFLTGFGGAGRSIWPAFADAGPSRVVALKLGGKKRIPEYNAPPLPKPANADTAPPESAAAGQEIYQSNYCFMCHGNRARVPPANGRYPDLRRISKETYDSWLSIVMGGMRSEGGMFSFADVLSEKEALALRDFVVHKAWTDYNAQEIARKGASK